MAEIVDGGGGTTTSVCTPSPSDDLAITQNLIKRISDIERFLAQLVGADVYANNLSELATNIGNILNGTITLPGSGNSPYGPGGSIPVPDGFNGTVISGNVITTWTDGVVSFQVIPSQGLVTGTLTKVDSYISSSVLNYTTVNVVHKLKGFTVSTDDGLVSVNASTGEITFNSSTGIYMIGYVGLYLDYPVGAGTNQLVTHGFGDGVVFTYGNLATTQDVTEGNFYSFSGNYLFNRAAFGAPSSMFLQLFDEGGGGPTRTADLSSLYVIKLKD